MKVRSLLFGMLCMLALGASLASCSDDDDNSWDDSGSKVTLPQTRAFFLNQGSWKANNAGISFYAPNKDAELVSDIFKKQNNAALGDNAQDLIEYEDRMYVSVNGSNYLAMLAAEDDYIYASFYNGFLAKINANTLKVEAKLGGLGDNLEGVTICNGVLYVANSYKEENGTWIYNKNVVTIDLHTFTKKADIIVTTNPNLLLEEDDKVFLISKGNFTTVESALQMIDPKSNKVTVLGSATVMCAEDDVLYWANSVTQDGKTYTNTFYKYDIKTGNTTVIDLAKQAPALASTSVGMMEVNESNGDIYVATSDYITNGDIYRFKKDGTLIDTFDSGGINPFAAVFFN